MVITSPDDVPGTRVLTFDRVGRFTDGCRQAEFRHVRHRTVRGWQRGTLRLFPMAKP